MKVIGFTEVYYTLWEVGEVYQEQIYSMGMVVGSVSKQQVTYIKNLSMDFEKAKAKLAGQTFDIDLELRGHSSFTRVTGTEWIDWETHFPQDVFSFGKMQGVPFAEATDLWQLNRAWREEKSARRRANARRRLIELGEVVRYAWTEKVTRFKNKYDNIYRHKDTNEVINLGSESILESKYAGEYQDMKWNFDGQYEEIPYTVEIPRKYATKGQLAELRIKEMEGHHFTNGEKVILEVKELKRFGFESMYGWSSVVIYETKCGKVVKYLGSSPITLKTLAQADIEKQMGILRSQIDRSMSNEEIEQMTGIKQKETGYDKDAHNEIIFDKLDQLEIELQKLTDKPEWCKIQGTVKHDNYRGPETKLIRIKQLFK